MALLSTHGEALADVVRSLTRRKSVGMRELASRMGQSSGNIGDKLKARRRWAHSDVWDLSDALDIPAPDLVAVVEHQMRSPQG